MAKASEVRIFIPALLCALLLGACGKSAVERNARRLTGGDPGHGELLVRRYEEGRDLASFLYTLQ